MLTFKQQTHNTFELIEFTITEHILAPADLIGIKAPDPVQGNFAHKGVVLSGRGPVWLYGFLIHYYHPVLWIATHDPRLQAAVVVASHTAHIKVGDLIDISTTPDDTP